MKKVGLLVILLLFVFTLSSCESLFESAYQSIEIDHFEPVGEDEIELLVGSDVPDFKMYVDRVTKDGVVNSKDNFDVELNDFDINTVGVYEIDFHFMSLEESVEYTLTVHVVEELSSTSE